MGRRFRIMLVATLSFIAMNVTTASAEHLADGQKSPCRPNPPASEEVLGYSDEGAQDDPQRELPTVYYNNSADGVYIGICGGGSNGAPIKYIQIDLTASGPFVSGSDSGIGAALAQTLGLGGDLRDLSFMSLDYYSISEYYAWIIGFGFEPFVAVSQDEVEVGYATDLSQWYISERYRDSVVIGRDETGKVRVGERRRHEYGQEGFFYLATQCDDYLQVDLSEPGAPTRHNTTYSQDGRQCSANPFISIPWLP